MHMDDGNDGIFTRVLGDNEPTLDTQVTIASGIIKGRTYRA